jgi:hypothetical protein
MDLELFLGLVFLLFWLACEALCIWLILKDRKCEPPICYGYHVGDVPPTRKGTDDEPNFYGK